MERVDAQAVKAPRSGTTLLIAAPSIDDPSLRWTGGFKWVPEIRDGSSAIGVDVDGGNANRTPPANPDVETFEPFLVWAADKTSTKDKTRDRLGKVRRALEAQQSALIAGEFWDGTIGNDVGNQSLASADAEILTVGGVPAGVALTYLDGALTRRLLNRQGMIHARPEMVTVWHAGNLLRYDAGSVFSPMGHLIVADAGYTGDGPRATSGDDPVPADGSSQWCYGTDVIALRLGKPETMPASNADDPDAVDRDTDDQVVWAQRLVGIQWDHDAHIAVECSQGALA